ncbi:EamA family transporter, partial [Pseudomonas aeruginosa]|nr:EamA family transporter [Pseudomonas aeruginosa]
MVNAARSRGVTEARLLTRYTVWAGLLAGVGLTLLYLALFGSVIAFGAYFTLVGRIGASKAAYSTLLFPLVALSISTVYEGYVWHSSAVIGLALILLGNLVMFAKPEQLL